jgi:hypothetical protein
MIHGIAAAILRSAATLVHKKTIKIDLVFILEQKPNRSGMWLL